MPEMAAPSPFFGARRSRHHPCKPGFARASSCRPFADNATISSPPNYRGYRFPPEIISHTVWLYHRFTLSLRDIEDLLAERNIIVSY